MNTFGQYYAMNLFQWIFAPLCGFAGAATLLAGRRLGISARYRILSFAFWSTATVVVVRPGIATSVAGVLGVGRGSDLISYLSIFCGVMAIRHFYLKTKRLESQLTEIIRREALRDASKEEKCPPLA